jgi:hypothetical protein
LKNNDEFLLAICGSLCFQLFGVPSRAIELSDWRRFCLSRADYKKPKCMQNKRNLGGLIKATITMGL